MKEIILKNSTVGISPRKVRQVCDLIRKKPVSQALNILRYCEKKEIAITLTTLLKGGLARAQAAGDCDLTKLEINTIYANEGKTLKRVRPRAQGRAFRIRKRTSKLFVRLKEV